MDLGRRLAGVALTAFLATCAASVAGEGPRHPPSVAQRALELQRDLARLDQMQPRSPQTFNDRLDFAILLATADDADCATHLKDAQAQLDRVSADRAVGIAIPSARARIADLEYRIHLGRATCGAAADRTQELRAAADAAQHASSFYREALDYRSMVVMQFNVGIVHREMDDLTGAVAAVESAIDLDREYGFLEDAQDNYGALVRWNAPTDSLERVAAQLRDFPKRSVTLMFDWRESDAQVSVRTQHYRIHTGGLIETHQTTDLTQHTRASGDGWRVTTEEPQSSYELGAGASDDEVSQQLMMLFARDLPRPADFEVTAKGEFEHALNRERFVSQLNKQEQELETDKWGPARSQHVARYAQASLGEALQPGVMEAKMAQAQSLETSAWNGATLEQGVWYEMQAPLFLPGTPKNLMMNRVEFAYTRDVPCTPDTATRSCVEIVVRFAPHPQELAQSLESQRHVARLPAGSRYDYRAATYVRLVTDPATLMPYEFEQRRYSYASADRPAPDEAIELESSSEQFRYQ